MTKFRSDLFAHLATPPGSQVNGEANPEANPAPAGRPADLLAAIASVRQAPSDGAVLRKAAIVFFEAGEFAYAADCYAALSRKSALDNQDSLNLGRVLLALNETGEAIALLTRDAKLRPSAEILAIAGELSSAGCFRPATNLLLHRTARRLDDLHYLRLLAFMLGQVKRPRAALQLAEAVDARCPGEHDIAVFRASQLAASGRHEDAASLLHNLPRKGPHEHELMASILSALGRHSDALAEIDAAVAFQPDSPAYLALRAAILSAMHRIEDAVADVLAARSLEPDNESINRSAFVIATEAGHYDAALHIGAWLVTRFPDEEAISQTLKIVMERRDRQRLLDRIDSSPPPQLPHPERARQYQRALKKHPIEQQARIILALLLRETKTRFGRARFGYFWVLFEPLAHIGIMITLISMFSHSQLPPIGTNFALFYFTGIIPYHLFTHTVSHMINAVPENRPLLQLPLVKVFDVFVARGVLELLTELVVAAILLAGFSVFGVFSPPDSIYGIVGAMALIWLTAFGLGLISAVINAFFPGWERIWGALSSILYFSSGTFYIPRMMPEYLRNILSWNPILQAIELIRSSYFYTPAPFWLDVRYMIGCALGMLALGLLAERIFRAKLLGTE